MCGLESNCGFGAAIGKTVIGEMACLIFVIDGKTRQIHPKVF